jgi:HK97 family phage prohead protease
MKNLTFPTYSIKGKPVEYKTFPFEVKSVDEHEGTITGYLSTFGNVDLGNDRVLPGAFKKTIAEAKGRMKNGRKFLFPILWMHDPEQPIGGFTDAQEDNQGLLCTAQLDISTNSTGIPNNPIATRIFSGFKMGYVDELSIGYLAIQKSYDKQGIRDLKECALLEGSGVTMNFAMNPDALVPASGVKAAYQSKVASGKTSWPLADRATTWESGQATKDIEAWANGDWNKVASCFFWIATSPPTKLDDCKLPFVANVGGQMKAVPQGIISCAGVIQGAMGGVDIPSDDLDAVKTKVKSYYTKMDMTPPWEESGKRRRMPQQKDFNDHYRDECISDWLWMDFRNLTAALQAAIMDTFAIGDTPQTDLDATVLNDGDASPGFITALRAYVQKGIDLGVSDYLNEMLQNNPYASSGSILDYCRRDPNLSSKAAKSGATFSAASKEALDAKAQDLQDTIAQHKAAMSDHMDDMQQKVSDLTQVWASEGQGPAYGNDKSRSTRREPLPALPRTLATSTAQQPPASTVDAAIDDLAALLR